jgi:hypothetical protein
VLTAVLTLSIGMGSASAIVCVRWGLSTVAAKPLLNRHKNLARRFQRIASAEFGDEFMDFRKILGWHTVRKVQRRSVAERSGGALNTGAPRLDVSASG